MFSIRFDLHTFLFFSFILLFVFCFFFSDFCLIFFDASAKCMNQWKHVVFSVFNTFYFGKYYEYSGLIDGIIRSVSDSQQN